MTDLSENPAVSLRQITKETVRSVCDLKVSESQKGFVAENAVSIAQAHFEPKAWFRAIYAGETPVGFIMLFDDHETQEYYLWRLMVAADYQGKGYGRQALELLIEYVRTRPNAAELLTSYVPGDGSPHGFYQSLGFVDTGVTHGIEKEMKLVLE